MTAITIRNDAGKVLRAIGIINNVDFLHETANIQSQALIKYLGDGILLVELGEGIDLNTLYVSPGFFTLSNHKPESTEDLGKSLLSMVYKQDLQGLFDELHAGVKENRFIDHVIRVNQSNGTVGWRHIRAVCIPYENSDKPVLLGVITDINALKQSEQKLMLSHERISFAFSQIAATIWEIDIATKTLNIWDNDHHDYNTKYSLINIPTSILERKIVHPDSAAELTAYCEDIFAGKPQGNCALILRQKNGRYSWSKQSYRLIYDQAGQAYKAIGICQNLPYIVDTKARFDREAQLQQVLKGELIASARSNLTTNSVDLFEESGDNRYQKTTFDSYNDLYQSGARVVFGEDDLLLYQSKFNIEAVKQAYAMGKQLLSLEYRHIDKHGNIQWVSKTMNLLTDPVNGDLYCFSYLRDIDMRKKWELALPQKIEHDSTTYLYTRDTTEAMITSVLATNPSELCALVIINIKGLSRIKETLGINIAEQILFSLGSLLRLLLDNNNILGRIDKNIIAVFLPRVTSSAGVTDKVKQIITTVQAIHQAADMNDQLSLICGIAVSQTTAATYTELYEKAHYALSWNIQQQTNNQFAVYNEIGIEEDLDKLLFSADDQNIEKDLSIKEVYGDTVAMTTLSHCLATLINANNFDEAMNQTLKYIGLYYQADRAYTLLLSTDMMFADCQHEWYANKKHPLMEQSNQIPLAKLLIIKKALKNMRTLIFNPQNINGNFGNNSWSFIVMPIANVKDNKTGFVCIENPKTHYDDITLLNSLLPLILAEMHKRQEFSMTENTAIDRQTGLLDRSSYLHTISEMQTEAQSTMGVIFIDINGLNRLNKQFGNIYGDAIIISIAKILSAQFTKDNVYRISGDEFIVLSKNITNNEFIKRTNSVNDAFDQEHPGQISMGFTWADKDIKIQKMIDHAESLMHMVKQKYYRQQEAEGDRIIPELFEKLQKDIAADRFKVYLQPKANVKTRKIVGAEALVRYIDQQGAIVTPDKFIPVLESQNLIRYLDFFFLDKTLQLMQTWRNKGKKIIPVSINFSRITLLDQSSLDSTMAIFNRYEISPEMIEIEITESLGGMERATVVQACNKFSDKGFHLSLDDFGSEYACLSILSAIHFDSLKLDKSIVNDIVSNQACRLIIENTLHICKGLATTCIAEGVETEEQLAKLSELGCELAQGYLFNKPIPAEDFSRKYL